MELYPQTDHVSVNIHLTDNTTKIYTNVVSVESTLEYFICKIEPPRGDDVAHCIPHRRIHHITIKPKQ